MVLLRCLRCPLRCLGAPLRSFAVLCGHLPSFAVFRISFAVICGPLRSFCDVSGVLCGPLSFAVFRSSFAVLCGPLRCLVLPFRLYNFLIRVNQCSAFNCESVHSLLNSSARLTASLSHDWAYFVTGHYS